MGRVSPFGTVRARGRRGVHSDPVRRQRPRRDDHVAPSREVERFHGNDDARDDLGVRSRRRRRRRPSCRTVGPRVRRRDDLSPVARRCEGDPTSVAGRCATDGGVDGVRILRQPDGTAHNGAALEWRDDDVADGHRPASRPPGWVRVARRRMRAEAGSRFLPRIVGSAAPPSGAYTGAFTAARAVEGGSSEAARTRRYSGGEGVAAGSRARGPVSGRRTRRMCGGCLVTKSDGRNRAAAGDLLGEASADAREGGRASRKRAAVFTTGERRDATCSRLGGAESSGVVASQSRPHPRARGGNRLEPSNYTIR